jgi:hypothetical protein
MYKGTMNGKQAEERKESGVFFGNFLKTKTSLMVTGDRGQREGRSVNIGMVFYQVIHLYS